MEMERREVREQRREEERITYLGSGRESTVGEERMREEPLERRRELMSETLLR